MNESKTKEAAEVVSHDATFAVVIVLAAGAMTLVSYATGWLLGVHSPETSILLGVGFALGIVPKYSSITTLRHLIQIQTKTMNLMEERIENLELILNLTKKKPEREPPGKG